MAGYRLVGPPGVRKEAVADEQDGAQRLRRGSLTSRSRPGQDSGRSHMVVLDVFLNDRKLCRAGVGNDGVLNAIASWVKLSGPALAEARRLERPPEEARLHVGGLAGNVHYSWSDRPLRPGDRITVVFGAAKTCDVPSRSRKRDVKEDERRERAYYLRLKAKFEKPGARSTRARRAASAATLATTRFLNVDLDIRSRVPLDPLLDAFGRRVVVLFAGREGRGHAAHLELAGETLSPDALVRRFVRLVERLPRAARASWNGAQSREFNVGVQAAREPHSFDVRLERATIQAVANVNGRIGLTVYGAGSELDRATHHALRG
jgi:hypothetical protein